MQQFLCFHVGVRTISAYVLTLQAEEVASAASFNIDVRVGNFKPLPVFIVCWYSAELRGDIILKGYYQNNFRIIFTETDENDSNFVSKYKLYKIVGKISETDHYLSPLDRSGHIAFYRY